MITIVALQLFGKIIPKPLTCVGNEVFLIILCHGIKRQTWFGLFVNSRIKGYPKALKETFKL